jgi:hypothetical protein
MVASNRCMLCLRQLCPCPPPNHSYKPAPIPSQLPVHHQLPSMQQVPLTPEQAAMAAAAGPSGFQVPGLMRGPMVRFGSAGRLRVQRAESVYDGVIDMTWSRRWKNSSRRNHSAVDLSPNLPQTQPPQGLDAFLGRPQFGPPAANAAAVADMVAEFEQMARQQGGPVSGCLRLGLS